MRLLNKVEKLFEDIALTDNVLKKELKDLSKSQKEIESVIFLKDSIVINNGRFDVGQGDYKSVQYDVKDILNKAKELGANAVISMHNHPNGTMHPSAKDIESFKKMKQYLGQQGIKTRAIVVAGDETDQVNFTEYDENTSPEAHTEEYIEKAKELIGNAVKQGHEIQISDDQIEQSLSTVKNITDFEQKINSILRPYRLKFVPKGA